MLHFEDLSGLTDEESAELCSIRNTRERWAEVNNREKVGSYSQIVEHINNAIINAEKLDIGKGARWPDTLGTRVYKLAESILNNI